jgi:putative phage-type endonuclease
MTMLYPKSREEWLQLRRGFVSSSESSSLFGLNKYQTAFELALEKSGKVVLPDDANERTEWGQLLERTIAKQFASEAGLRCRAMTGYADAGKKMGSSFDFEIVGLARAPMASPQATMYLDYGPGILEIKNVDAYIYRQEWTKEEAPPHIECQIQHQLEACAREWAIIAVLVGGNRLETHVRRRDRAVGAALRQRIGSFWSDLAAARLPDPVLPRDASLVAALYRSATHGEVANLTDDFEVRNLVVSYDDCARMERTYGDQKKIVKAKLLPLIGTASKVICGDYTLSCGEVAETEVPAYTRRGYRNFRITKAKDKNGKDQSRDEAQEP